MEVEIYDMRELNSETLEVEQSQEALDLIQELGLDNQLSENEEPVIYPSLTADQEFVVGWLFPTRTDLKHYRDPLPVRVLKEIREAQEIFGGHEKLYVLHSPPAEIRDPVLLFLPNSYNYDNARIIARWGDALESWDQLMQRARQVMEQSIQRMLVRLSALAQTNPAGLEDIPRWSLVPMFQEKVSLRLLLERL